jgi:hypothetical protein
MALILAIEPDRRQAAQLARLIQSRVGAELVLADTTEQALGAIGNRVPDLVLVPALLAPQDDATLATALRVIAAAAHVQMLTIPLLAPTRGAAEPLGMLARLRRRRTDPVPPDGCDPDVFGDQIAAYLAEAAAQRAIIESDLAIERSTLTAQDTADTQAIPADAPDRSIHVVRGREHSIEEPTVVVLPIAAVETFTVAELTVERATIELHVETALFAAAAEPFMLAEPAVEQQAASEGEFETLVGVTTQDAKDTKGFFLDGLDVRGLAERTIVEREIGMPVAFTTEDANEISLDSPDLGVPCVLGGDVLSGDDATVEDLQLAAAIELVATSADELSARLDSPKRIAVSEAPWFGPQRRWPDLEGEEAVDRLTVFAVEDTADADVHVHAASVPVAAASLIEEVPAILAALDESAAVVIEEAPVVVQDALPVIDTAPLAEPVRGAVLELWMPLSFGSTRSWPTLEGVWSEARPDPPVTLHADPPALVHSDPPALVHADPPAPVHADPPTIVHADPPAVAAAPAAPSPAADRVPPPDAIATRPEWIELIESLRQDVKRLRSERTPAPVAGPRTKEIPIPVARPSATLRRAAVPDEDLTPKKRATSAKPAQDEWGFFDPEQCGFAALLAKLDEITHVPDGA